MIVRRYCFLFLFLCLLGSVKAYPSGLCEGIFSEESIKSFFSDSQNKEKYQEREGYEAFVREYFPNTRMDIVFSKVSSTLGKKEFQKLEWQKFQGTVTEFQNLRGQILLEDGTIREKYVGMEGYAKFAEEHNNNKMQTAFKNVSAVLSKKEFQKLEWQAFQGTVTGFQNLRGQILFEDGTIREKYVGMEGYAKFAEENNNNKMQPAFKNVSAVLSKKEFQRLEWQAFQGTVIKFQNLRGQIVLEDGIIRHKYLGMDGYAKFAEEHNNNQMSSAFENVSAVLSKKEFQKLEWQKFQGTVTGFQNLRGQILLKDGTIKKEYLSMEGYAKFAEEHNNNRMQPAFKDVSAVLSKKEFQRLEWQQFYGTVTQFQNLRGQILFEDGTIKKEYLGMEGYAKFAEENNNNRMHSAFQNVSAVLSKKEFQRLEWQQFYGTVTQFRNLRGQILFEDGTIRDTYVGMEGYAKFAEENNNNQMHSAFINVSAVLSKKEFQKLEWQQFQGTVTGFQNLRGQILFEDGTIREKYVGMEGYAKFAEEHNNNRMQPAFINVSAVLSKKEFQKLEWQQFQGTVIKFQNLRGQILFEDGTIKKEYLGMEGYAKFAEEHNNNQMHSAFQNVSAVLSKKEFQKLEWQHFQGTVTQFYQFIEDFQNYYPQGYQTQTGQQRVADEIFSGNTRKTYRMLSIMKDFFWLG